MEENEEQEDTEEQDEEKMKTSDEVLYGGFICFQQKDPKYQLTPFLFSHPGHSRTRSYSLRGNVIHRQLHSAKQIHLFRQCQK